MIEILILAITSRSFLGDSMSQTGLASLSMTLQDTENFDGVPKAKERKNGQDHEILASDFKTQNDVVEDVGDVYYIDDYVIWTINIMVLSNSFFFFVCFDFFPLFFSFPFLLSYIDGVKTG
jgi:hypothetical protein